MCGRFTSLTPPEELAGYFAAEPTDDVRNETFSANYNVAPSTNVLAVALSASGERRIGRLKWGLIPHWAKETRGTGQINARSETVAEKPTFRDSFRKRRCIVPMSGYYEWRTVPHEGRDSTDSNPSSSKVPKRAVYVTREDDLPLAVAGLWSVWRGSDTRVTRSEAENEMVADSAGVLRSCCIITRAANELLAPVHDRMPFVLDPADWPLWLGEEEGEAQEVLLQGLMRSDANTVPLRYVDVGPLVNSVRNNGPDLIREID